MSTEELKKRIDEMSYEELLHHWRFAPAGNPMFQGEVGKYYSEVMAQRRAKNPEEHIQASKAIGWED